MPLEYAHQLKLSGQFADPGPWKKPAAIPKPLTAPLGIDALAKQRVVRTQRTPFMLNVLVAGETGLGKTTFINTLFDSKLTEQWKRETVTSKTVEIKPVTFELVEPDDKGKEVALHLTVIDTPGFGDSMNRDKDLSPILNYIDVQNHAYFNAENLQSPRGDIRDTRVHCVFYFIAPSGTGGLRDIDKFFLENVGPIVNVVPLIAKADTLTPEELTAFKKRILKDIQTHGYKIYPEHWSEDHENFKSLAHFMPFAVIGSDYYIDIGGGKQARGRSYKWGNVLVEDPKHCDFIYLRELLIRRNLVDLVETTNQHHYAGHRGNKLSRPNRPRSILECDDEYDGELAEAKRGSEEEMKRKEDEIRAKFVAQVKETEAQLREREEKLSSDSKRFTEELERLKAQLEAEAKELEELERQRNMRRTMPATAR